MRNYLLIALLLLWHVNGYGRTQQVTSNKLPLSFIEHKGQLKDQNGHKRKDVDFILPTPGMTLYIGNGQLHYQYKLPSHRDTAQPGAQHKPKKYQVTSNSMQIYRLDMELLNCNRTASFQTEGTKSERFHYYNNHHDSSHITDVGAYTKIIYKNIYPAIDWVIYLQDNGLKYDFIVHPGGKVSDIKMKYKGAKEIKLDNNGNLDIVMPFGKLTEAAPYSYAADTKNKINSQYTLRDGIVGFRAAQPKEGTLVIDPGVSWATYFGSAGMECNFLGSVASDHQGNVYISGFTDALSGIATTGAHQVVYGGGFYDHFLAKFDSLGALQWATYYGGGGTTDALSGLELYGSVTCDRFGHVYLVGQTFSETNIATPGSHQSAIDPLPYGLDNSNGYLVQFNSSGIRNWGTYYGASAHYTAFLAVACDQDGNIYALGHSDSSSSTNQLSSTGAHQLQCGGALDALLVKFDSSGNRLWATYYGGQGFDEGHTVVCDASGAVYIGGWSGPESTVGIASPGAFQQSPVTSSSMSTGFLARFSSTGTRLWGTYLNGQVNSLAIDPYNHLYIAGTTNNTTALNGLATPGSWLSTSLPSNRNAFLLQFNAVSGNRIWGTYYGADNYTEGTSVSCDASGNVYFAGTTSAYDPFGTQAIASAGSHQDSLSATPGQASPKDDMYLVQFDSTGQRKWATYFGGTETEATPAVICDPGGAIYTLLSTSSPTGIATFGSQQSVYGGSSDAALVRWLPKDIGITKLLQPESDSICASHVPLKISIKNHGRMDKSDTLFVTLQYAGPDNGTLDTFFTQVLPAGAVDTLSLGNAPFNFSGMYTCTLFLHYTRDDNERNNDTLHFFMHVADTPVAHIQVNQLGTVFHFSNDSLQLGDQSFWDFGDGQNSTNPTPQHQYNLTDTYRVMYVVSNFCSSDTAYVDVAGIGNGTGIQERDILNSVTLYPNPASSTLMLSVTPSIQILSCEILDIPGRRISNGKFDGHIDVGHLSKGTYFLKLKTSHGMVVKKFVVNRP